MATIPDQSLSTNDSQPAWDVALLFPSQGDWSEFDYLYLETNQLVELVDGNLEVLPMPAVFHQLIVRFLFRLLENFVTSRKFGTVLFAPMPIRIRHKTFREPDVVVFTEQHDVRAADKYLKGAALVVEVVSPDEKSHKRDYEEKRADYAELGIAEYWIVDPQLERITMLVLKDNEYRVHGEFAPGQQAGSVLLDGFAVDVSAVFAAGKQLS
jgi:Uma2 family endonuclease